MVDDASSLGCCLDSYGFGYGSGYSSGSGCGYGYGYDDLVHGVGLFSRQ